MAYKNSNRLDPTPGIYDDDFDGEDLCQNPDCPNSPLKHRHSTKECMDHLFCAEPPLQAIDGTYKDLPEKLPLYGTREFREIDKLMRQRLYKNGKWVGHNEIIKQDPFGWFGHEEPIPDGKKLLVTEEVMDSWLAAHYGLTLENVPPGRPHGMEPNTYNRLKKYFAKYHAIRTQEKKKKNKNEPAEDENKQDKFNNLGGAIVYQISPSKFENMYYSDHIKVKSYVGLQLQEIEEEKKIKAARKAAKRKDREQSASPGSPGSPVSSDNQKKREIIGKNLDLVVGTQKLETQKSSSPIREKKFKMTAQSSVKITPDKRYSIPSQYVRNRINSECLSFLNYSELEQATKKQIRELSRGPSKEKKATEPEKKEQDYGIIVHGVQTQALSFKHNQDRLDQMAAERAATVLTTKTTLERPLSPKVQKKVKELDLDLQNKAAFKQKQNISELLKMQEVQTSMQFSQQMFRSPSASQNTNISFKGFKENKKMKTQKYRSNNISKTQKRSKKQSFCGTFSPAQRPESAHPQIFNQSNLSIAFQTTVSLNNPPFVAASRNANTYLQNTGDLVASAPGTRKNQRYVTNKKIMGSDIFSRPMSSGVSTGLANTGTNTSLTNPLRSYVGGIGIGKKTSSMSRKTFQTKAPQAPINLSQNQTDAETPRVITQISGPDFQALMRRNSTSKASTALGRPLDLSKNNPVRDAISTNLRIKNERVTSKILLEQQNLQQILSNQFKLKVSEVELPIYTKIQNLDAGVSADHQKYFDTSINLLRPSFDNKTGKNSMFSDNSIINLNRNSSSKQQLLCSNLNAASSVEMPLGGNSTMNFQHIKNNFGIMADQSQNYHKVAERGFRQMNHKIIAAEEAKRQQENKQPPPQDQEMEPTQSDLSSKDEFRLQNENILTKKILEDLSDIPIRPLTRKKNAVTIVQAAEDLKIDINQFTLDLTVDKVYKDFKDYRFWLQQAQLRKVHPSDWESPLDYLASGLRELPLNLKLLYNYGCVNEKLGNFDMAIKFFDYAMEIRPRWPDALFGKAVTYFKQGLYEKSRVCINTAIHNYKSDSFEKLEVFQYFQAMCYKNLGEFRKAERDYGALYAIFKQMEGENVLNHVVGSILLPLQENRKIQHDFVENTVSLITFFQPSLVQPNIERLQNYVYQDGPKQGFFNIEKYSQIIYKILSQKAFFRRFSKEIFMRNMGEAHVEYFKKDQIIFLKGRVGVISHGSVRVISHQSGIMQPTTIGKYTVGRILGHGPSDNDITVNSQTWFITFDQDTEIVFFDYNHFCKIWNLQCFQSSKLILSAFLQKNRLWNCLSEQTKHHLVFECMEIRKFRPGQLICRMNKQSALNKDAFGKFYLTNSSKFKDQIENAKLVQGINQEQMKQFGGKGTQSETLMSSFVKSLTAGKSKHHGFDPMQKLERLDKIEKNVSKSKERKNETEESLEQCKVHVDKKIEKTSKNILEELSSKANEIPFNKILAKVKYLYQDHSYKEVDGIYFIYHGYADVVNPKKRECIYSIGIYDNFGESKVVKNPGFEYMGDIYAGLYPPTKITPMSGKEQDIQTKLKDKLKKDMGIKYLIECETSEIIQNINSEECVVCLFIPYEKFFEVVPINEIKKIQENQEMQREKDGIVNLIANKYGIETQELHHY